MRSFIFYTRHKSFILPFTAYCCGSEIKNVELGEVCSTHVKCIGLHNFMIESQGKRYIERSKWVVNINPIMPNGNYMNHLL
jgi:hypothetical protein